MHLLTRAIGRALRTPQAPALIAAEATLSWSETIDSAARIATLLQRSGVRPGQVVAISGEFSPIMQAVLILATWYRAAVSCTVTGQVLENPPFTLDWVISPHHPPASERSGVIVLDAEALTRLAGVDPAPAPEAYASADEVCRLVFSSGTTGSPKAIPFSIARLTERIRSARERWMPATPFMALLGIATVSGFQTFAEALRSGEPYLVAGTSAQNVQLLAAHRVRAIKGSPVQLAGLAAELERTGAQLPHLQVIESAGSMLPNRLRDTLRRLTKARVVNLYGSSEVGTVAIGEPGDSVSGLAGRVVDDVEVQVVRATGEVLPEGEEGAIRVRRAGQPDGYFRDPVASRGAFHDGWFLPGDIGFLRGGELYVRGRTSEVINAAGVKVVPSALEQSLLQVTGVDDIAVFSHADALGVERVTALFVGTPDLRNPAWQARLRAELGDAAPARCIRVARIPRNENGKILRGELAAQVSAEDESADGPQAGASEH